MSILDCSGLSYEILIFPECYHKHLNVVEKIECHN